MKHHVRRETVDLSAHPDLVVIHLGMKVNALTGLKTLFGFGPKINTAVNSLPRGLLAHEYFLFSLFPPHVGIRQYWHDFDALEAWAHSEPHRLWWQRYLRNTGGTGFWHETYFRTGGMEAVYVDVSEDLGFRRFAPVRPARGGLFSARGRARRSRVPPAEAERGRVQGPS